MPQIDVKSLNVHTLPSVSLEDKQSLPKCSCIYLVYSGNRILYIGRAVNLARRWANHHREAELKTFDSVEISWLEVGNVELLKEIEKTLIQHFKPVLNHQLVTVKKPTEYSHGTNPKSLQNLSREGRPALYNQPKRRRTLEITDAGWHGFTKFVKNAGYNSITDYIEKVGRHHPKDTET